MGSGCFKGPNTKIKCDSIVYDQCVLYTGEPIEELGICTNDSYEEIISTIITKLLAPPIEYPNIAERCTELSSIIGTTSPTLVNIVDAIAIFTCQIKGDLDALSNIVNAPPFIYNLYCLSVTGIISTEKVLQELIKQHCNLVGAVSTLQNQVNSIQNQVDNSGITITSENPYSISQSGNTYTLKGFIQPYMPLPYIGPLTNFDASGKGIASLGWKDWYIMNGNNGTQDWRGFSFGGATSVVGPTLNPLVDPVSLSNPDAATNIGSTKGKIQNKLVQANLPDHTHSLVLDSFAIPTHTHNYIDEKPKDVFYNVIKEPGYQTVFGSAGPIPWTYVSNLSTQFDGIYGIKGELKVTAPSTPVNIFPTGTVGSMLNIQNLPIDNRPPTKYGLWVVWIP